MIQPSSDYNATVMSIAYEIASRTNTKTGTMEQAIEYAKKVRQIYELLLGRGDDSKGRRAPQVM
jgi:hypothetical protein